ncbi:protein dml1 [Teratosphaeria destructans]|uniref:Protein dml1 n=1 Tax=Teratosphaeria destructans TaxID=418781 RepID=A0A9W7SMC0_9PEZI|nr:protein dml1 [Teratosphaeria destructans]
MHEILTLQFGPQANYLGTHYWNTQESYFTYAGQADSPIDHDVSFRAGIGADGHDTYTPRTLIYDLKGAFGTLRRENALYEVQQGGEPDGEWGGATGTELPRLTTETSALMPFERWRTGEEVFAGLDREEDLLDRDLRPWLEECDCLQGVQVWTGWDGAWGGFAARYLERMADELGKGSRWVYGLGGGRGRGLRERRVEAEAAVLSMVAFQGSASMVLPMDGCPGVLPRYVRVDAGSRWHTGALQAALVESVSLPMRLRVAEEGRASSDGFEATLGNDGKRTVVGAGLSVDEDLSEGHEQTNARVANGFTNGYHHEDEEDGPDKLDIDFFPDFTISPEPNNTNRTRPRPHIFSTTTTLRGNWASLIEPATASSARTSTHHCPLLFPLLSSFPPIFAFQSQPKKLAIKARLETSTAVATKIRELEGVARRVLEVEEREALGDVLGALAGEYEEGWSDDDEAEWDDD